MDDGRLDALGQTIGSALPGAATHHTVAFGQLTVAVLADKIVDVVKFLRDDPNCRFVNFTDVTAVDYPGREKRFEVIYHLLSPTLNARIRLRVAADETTQVPSIIDVFPGANWFERETYDLYGVLFSGHPDMRRPLTDSRFEGHPLRKGFRIFDFLSPWEGPGSPLPGDEKAAQGRSAEARAAEAKATDGKGS